jgi:hypothetical protein
MLNWKIIYIEESLGPLLLVCNYKSACLSPLPMTDIIIDPLFMFPRCYELLYSVKSYSPSSFRVRRSSVGCGVAQFRVRRSSVRVRRSSVYSAA